MDANQNIQSKVEGNNKQKAFDLFFIRNNNTPLRILLIVMISIFLCEMFVMFLLSCFSPISVVNEAFIDSALLSLIIAPILYHFLFQPLVKHLYERKNNEKKLKTMNYELEKKVIERASELIETNKKLKLEINEHILASESLKENEEKYRSIFDNSKDIIFVMSEKGIFVDINPAAFSQLHYKKEEILNKKIEEVMFIYDSKNIDFLSLINKNGYLIDFPIDLNTKEGEILHTLVTFTSTKDINDKVVNYQGLIKDITEQKLKENKLEKNVEVLRKVMSGTIQAMALTVEMRDPYTAGHQRRVSNLARAIAQEMHLTEDQVDSLRMAGIVHDLGKISIPAEILSKPGRITEIEFSLIKTHSQVGYDILKTIDFPWPIADIVIQHHERINGTGYPNGLTGDKILLEAKILVVADVVEAMASHRPYRASLGIDKALEEIQKNSGIFYDPKAVEACVKVFREKNFKFE